MSNAVVRRKTVIDWHEIYKALGKLDEYYRINNQISKVK